MPGPVPATFRRLTHQLSLLLAPLQEILQLDVGEDLLRDVVEVPDVAMREDDLLDAGAVRGEDLLLHATDRQRVTTQVDLAGDRDVVADRALREDADDRAGEGDLQRVRETVVFTVAQCIAAAEAGTGRSDRTASAATTNPTATRSHTIARIVAPVPPNTT